MNTETPVPPTKRLSSGPQRKHGSEKKQIVSRKVQEGNVSSAELRFGVAELLSESPRPRKGTFIA